MEEDKTSKEKNERQVRNAYSFFMRGGVALPEKEQSQIALDISKEAGERGISWERVCVEWINASKIDRLDEEQMKSIEEAIRKEDEENIINKLFIYFKDEDTAKRFLKQVIGKKDSEICDTIKKYAAPRLCINTSKDLWRVLYEVGIFKTDYPNYNKYMNRN